MDATWILFLFSALMALGWSFINGNYRRDKGNRQRLAGSIAQFPKFTKRKLQRLMVPTSFVDRWNHATVIAGCVTIIGIPVALAAWLFGNVAWWMAILLLVGGSLLGSYFGEAVFNWGCSFELPNDATHPPKADEGVHEGQAHTP